MLNIFGEKMNNSNGYYKNSPFTLKTKMDGSMILGEVQVKGTFINEKMLDSGLVKKFGE